MAVCYRWVNTSKSLLLYAYVCRLLLYLLFPGTFIANCKQHHVRYRSIVKQLSRMSLSELYEAVLQTALYQIITSCYRCYLFTIRQNISMAYIYRASNDIIPRTYQHIVIIYCFLDAKNPAFLSKACLCDPLRSQEIAMAIQGWG